MRKRGYQEEEFDPFEYESLPNDLVYETLGHLDYPSLVKLCRSDKNIRALCNTELGRKIINLAKINYGAIEIKPLSFKDRGNHPIPGRTVPDYDIQIGNIVTRVPYGVVYDHDVHYRKMENPEGAKYIVTKVTLGHNVTVQPLKNISGNTAFIDLDAPEEIIKHPFLTLEWKFYDGDLAYFDH